MTRPCNSAEYIAGDDPSAAQNDGPGTDGERHGYGGTDQTGEAILIFGYSDGLLHPLTQICAQAASRGYCRTGRQEGRAERSAMGVLSGLRTDLIWRAVHAYWCKAITDREQAAIHLVLILNSFAFRLQSTTIFLRRLLLPAGRSDLNRHGIPTGCQSSSLAHERSAMSERDLPAAETILPGIPA